MTDLILIDGLLADADTGEVEEWPSDAPDEGAGRIAYFIALKRGAKEAAETWGRAERVYQHVVNNMLMAAGVSSLKTDLGNATSVKAGALRKAYSADVAKAVDAELLSHSEAETLLLIASKDLDTAKVETFIDGLADERADPFGDIAKALASRKKALRAILVTETPRASYALITAPTVKPPRIGHRQPDGELADQLAASIEAVSA